MIYELYSLLHSLMTVYIWIIIISAFMSFIRPDPHNPIVQVIYRLTEPAFNFVRQKLPFSVFSGIDLSPLVIVIGLQVIDIVIRNTVFG